ncbi:hypothetical protein CYMTET_29096 [Cymbomonas tetramitiformis]|uniref:Uncharacterized protein n=1 Tax=Cymbomonas tetramitiformis TaxID=36881 RepID=A0AAE0FLH8_9CHLO|nr:hypothetical protein CYMTET_29096 [Cymbomonas tetramitiformis]
MVEAVLGVEDMQAREVKQAEAEELGKMAAHVGGAVERGAGKGDRMVRGVDAQEVGEVGMQGEEVGMQGEEVVMEGWEVV